MEAKLYVLTEGAKEIRVGNIMSCVTIESRFTIDDSNKPRLTSTQKPPEVGQAALQRKMLSWKG